MQNYSKKVNVVCACGNTFRMLAKNVTTKRHTGKCRSCRRRDTIYLKVPPFMRVYKHVKSVALRRGIGFTLTFEEFLFLTAKTECFYCEAPLVWRARTKHGESLASNLDRKDSKGIYEKANLVQCCGTCNRIKSDRLTFDQMCSLAPTLKALSKQIQQFQGE
jgi:hypothetical protein